MTQKSQRINSLLKKKKNLGARVISTKPKITISRICNNLKECSSCLGLSTCCHALTLSSFYFHHLKAIKLSLEIQALEITAVLFYLL